MEERGDECKHTISKCMDEQQKRGELKTEVPTSKRVGLGGVINGMEKIVCWDWG